MADSGEAQGMSQSEPTQGIHAEYRELRRARPVSRDADAPWRVACYEDVRHVLKTHGVFSSLVSRRMEEDPSLPPSMLFSDPPIHTRLRTLVSRAFTPRQIATQAVQIEARRVGKRSRQEPRL
jgi:cytochrome P450